MALALAAAGLLVVPSARAEVHFDATCVQVNETLNATKMAELYRPNAILLATVSNAPRTLKRSSRTTSPCFSRRSRTEW
eukprot:ANDGO_07318.mRNA.1 hypothetical protein